AHRAVQRVAPVEKRGDPKSTGTPRHEPRGSGAKAKPAKPPPPPPPETEDLSPFAPDDANLVVLLRMDKLRKSPHRAGAEALTATDMGDPRIKWLAQLEQFDQVAQAENGPAVLVTLSDAPALVRFGAGLPTPQAIALAATGDASPAVRVRVVFANADEAQAFTRAWPDILQRYRSATALLGLSR